MKKLVWLDINSSYSHSSLALPSIEACRQGDGFEWHRVSGTINSDIYLLTKELYAARPSIVAATLWLFNHEVTLKVCERLRSLLPDVRIILGGPEFNGCNDEFLRRNRFVDQVFRGEGEEGFHQILRGDDPATITGLCYLDPHGNYCDNGTARVLNFEDLPSPESSRFFNFDSPFVQLEFSRGCFNSCAFCVSGGDKPIRSKPVDHIEERIRNVESHGIKDVRVLDRTFNYSPQRAKQMLELFTRFPKMNFHLEIHPALLTDGLCELLSTMPKGLLHLEAGMQSLDDKVIEACGRIGANEAAFRGLSKLCAMDNFETHADLIAGLPHYTFEQILSDVRTLSSIEAGEIQLELLKLLPGTKMRREAAQNGISYSSTPPYEVLQTPDITIFELDRARLLSKLLDKFYNTHGWQQVTRQLINNVDNFLVDFLDYLIPTELLEKPLSFEKRGSLLYNFCLGRYPKSYVDQVSIAWIESGLSLRKVEAGNISKAYDLPEGVEREPNAHYYLWQGSDCSIVYCYDRSREHSKPIRYDVEQP